MASSGNLRSAKSEQLFKSLLQRNSCNQAAIKKFIKRIQQRDKLIKSIQQLKAKQHNKYGICLPCIYKNNHKTSIMTDPPGSTEKQTSIFKNTQTNNQKFMIRNATQIDIIKKTHKNIFENNNTQIMIRKSIQNQCRRSSYVNQEGIVISQMNQLCKLKIHKRNLREFKQGNSQQDTQGKDLCQNRFVSFTNLTSKTPLNLKNIVFQNQSEKIILNQFIQKKNKKIMRKNMMKNFILSSSIGNSEAQHKNIVKYNKQNDATCINLIKKEAALMKSISKSLDKLLYSSILKTSSDVKQVMMKVNAITIK